MSELYAAKASQDAPVAVRGKVVKYNPGVMGKNWIHLRDGSGSTEKKDNDLAVTTSDSAAVGDVVLVKGKVRLDRDFGSGYVYPVIVEDAKVSKKFREDRGDTLPTEEETMELRKLGKNGPNGFP